MGAAPATSALLERDVELGRLSDALAEAGSGRGRVIFVGGEAGIGKSSLVSTFAASVGDGTRVAFGRGDALVAELAAIAHKSNGVIATMAPRLQWVHSYVTDDALVCVYLAEDEEAIREHGRRGGFPVDGVRSVRTTIDPTTAGV